MADTRATEADTATESVDGRRERPLWSQTTFVLSVALVVVLIAAGCWLAFTGPSSPHPATAAPSSQPQPSTALVDGCGPAADPAGLTPATAPATSWALIGHMAAPSSATAGPASSSDGVPTCYAPDATGALFAAANFVAATTSSALRLPAVQHLTADGPGRDAALTDLVPCTTGQTTGCGQGPGPDSYGIQLAGFAFLSYGSGNADIDLALSANGEHVHLELHLTWTGQDWQLVLPVTGSPFGSISALPSCGKPDCIPAGYSPWQGA